MQERITLYMPNGKHGVNTLNCTAKYQNKYIKDNGNYYTIEELSLLKDYERENLKSIKEPIYPSGWMPLTQEQLEGLKNKTLAWENGVLVEYFKTADEVLEEMRIEGETSKLQSSHHQVQ